MTLPRPDREVRGQVAELFGEGREAAPPNLTPRQARTVAFIRDYATSHGYPPTVREIGTAIGLRSPSSTHAVLKLLRDKGVLTMESGLPRTLRLTDGR